MSLDLILKDIKDSHTKENFLRLSRYIQEQTILDGNWKFFEIDLKSGGTHRFKHNLKFKPQDIIVMSSEGDKNFYFLHEEFDRTYIKVVTNGPVRLRFLAGSYIEQGFLHSTEDFTTVAPPTPSECGTGGITWYTGNGIPGVGLGSDGDLYLNLDNGDTYEKAAGVWVLVPTVAAPITSAVKLQITRVAAEDITKGELVKADSPTHVSLATGDTTSDEATVLGIAATTVLSGVNVDIVLMGAFDDAAFGIFTVNDPLYLDVDGGIRNDKRPDGFVTPVGKSLGGTEIFIAVQPPAVIA